MRTLPLAMVAAALVACGSDNNNNNGNPDGGANPDGGGTPSCSITLSGAVSKTLTCTVVAAYATSDNTSGVGITSPGYGGGSVPEVTFALKVTGELQQTTYTWANSADQGASLYQGGSSAWVASSSSSQGSSQVQLTSLSTTATVSSGKVYAVHGTATATLAPQGGASGNVTMTISF